MPQNEGAHFETEGFPPTLKRAETGAFLAALWASVFSLALWVANRLPKGRQEGVGSGIDRYYSHRTFHLPQSMTVTAKV